MPQLKARHGRGLAALAALITDPVLRGGNVAGAAAAVYAVGLASAGLVLGCVVLAMILAHWYLIDPGMPIAPLNRVVGIFLGTEVLKLALLGAIVLIHAGEWTSADGGLLLPFVLGAALFVAVRTVLGMLPPLGVSWMPWTRDQIRTGQAGPG